MRAIRLGVIGVLVVCLDAVSAETVQISSVSVQQSQVEGQSVEIRAGVDFGSVSSLPLVHTARVVRAILQAPKIVAVPEIPTTITLTRDSDGGLYKGIFHGLPYNAYTVRIEATKTVSNCRQIPCTLTRDTATADADFRVHPRSGCFKFDGTNNLHNWTAVGIFDGDTARDVSTGPLQTTWASWAGFLSPGDSDLNGGLVLSVPSTSFPTEPEMFTTGWWRIDLRTKGLETIKIWNDIDGLSFRMLSRNLVHVQPILVTRAPDGSLKLYRQEDEWGNPVFLTLPGGEDFWILVGRVSPPPGHRVAGVQIRMFGAADGQPPTAWPILIDGICPRRNVD